jgi:hypothetical protein
VTPSMTPRMMTTIQSGMRRVKGKNAPHGKVKG